MLEPKPPFVLRLNPLFRLFGWELWWRWETLAGETFSYTCWRRYQRAEHRND